MCPLYSGSVSGGSASSIVYSVFDNSDCGVYVCPGYIVDINGCPSAGNGLANGVTCSGDPFFEIIDSHAIAGQGSTLYASPFQPVNGVTYDGMDDDTSCTAWAGMPSGQDPELCPRSSYTQLEEVEKGCYPLIIKGGCVSSSSGLSTCSSTLMVTVTPTFSSYYYYGAVVNNRYHGGDSHATTASQPSESSRKASVAPLAGSLLVGSVLLGSVGYYMFSKKKSGPSDEGKIGDVGDMEMDVYEGSSSTVPVIL